MITFLFSNKIFENLLSKKVMYQCWKGTIALASSFNKENTCTYKFNNILNLIFKIAFIAGIFLQTIQGITI